MRICGSSFPAARFVGERAAQPIDHSSKELKNTFAKRKWRREYEKNHRNAAGNCHAGG